jgi:hypothetical protein
LLYKGVTCAFFNLSGKTLLIYWHIYNTCNLRCNNRFTTFYYFGRYTHQHIQV